MKKLFSLISVLITLSLVGLILLQVSWIKNNIALREDQMKQRIENVLFTVGNDLSRLKSQYVSTQPNDPFNLTPFNNYHNLLSANTISSRMSAKEINERIQKAFDQVGLKDLKFEYGIVVGLSENSLLATIEKHSPNFSLALSDSLNNFYPRPVAILSLPSSLSENLANDEALHLVVLNLNKYVIKSLTLNIILVVLFTALIITAFYVTVYTMLRQKKLSDIKNDFINNMTHEFKTPIATISLAVDALKNEKVLSNRDKMNYFSGIIKEENQRMNKQVETILKASQFDRQEADFEKKSLHVHDIIYSAVDNFVLQLSDKNGDAELKLEASNDVILGDEVHFANLVNNLIDNAVKYSKDNVPIHLKIASSNKNGKLILQFEDNGIGMSKDTQKRVFEKFYRAHTGNLHNVKGFGLGLSYVKSVVHSHNGMIKLDSVLGKGSTFTIEFPLEH